MDDAAICEHLKQIFPQIEPRVIERTVEEAKTNEGVDILTHCIEVVLARQEQGTWFGDNNNDLQGNDDVVVVKSIRKETSRKGKTRDIPLVCVKEVGFSDLSDYDSPDSDSRTPESEIDENEDDKGIRLVNEGKYLEGNTTIMSEFKDENLDNHISNLRVPPLITAANPAHQQVAGKASLSKFEYPLIIPGGTLGHYATATTNLPPGATSNRQPATTNRQFFNHQFITSANPQFSPIPINHQPITTLNPSATPNQSALATSNHPSARTPGPQPSTIKPNSPKLVSDANSHLDIICQMYPKVNVDFIKNLSQQGYDINGIVNMLIDRPDMQNSGSSSKEPAPTNDLVPTKEIDYFTEFSQMATHPFYTRQCETLLRNEFQRVSVNDIRQALSMCNHHYAPARKLIEEALLNTNPNQRGKSPQITMYQSVNVVQKSHSPSTSPTTPNATTKNKFTICRLLANKRPQMRIMENFCSELQLEIDFVKKQTMLNEEKKNAIYAAQLNKQQYEDEGELIECGCCFGEFPFEEIVQCSDGHLFCKECLHGYAKEIIFGSAMASAKLSCMQEDCDRTYPYNQLEKCLTKDEIDKYQCRLQEDCLAKAEIPNLHQCAFCEFAAIISEQQKVFTCLNPKCMKESCIECKEEWKDHFGKKCNEIEKKSQTNLRLSYEERMTMAKVRKCAKCSLTFTKLDGCNKMTCRCGTSQCYVCRKSPIDYVHFCRHPRDPGRKCQKCGACSLWTDSTEDDELAIRQLQEEASEAKRKLVEEIQQHSSKKQKVGI
jgi:TRIAD3 protein (E3 ubiquitin-protein ligase RNF216)